MKIITINLPEKYLAAIQVLNDLGIYPNRSEAIRSALRQFLKEELQFSQTLDDENIKLTMRSRRN